MLPTVQAVSELGDHLPDPFDADEAAATHYQLFDFNVFPYESIFLDSSGLLGGQITDAVTAHYRQFGFAVELSAHNPDHMGQELAALSFLCQLEADALQRAVVQDAVAFREQQLRFLQAHLLLWLPPFTLAIRQQGDDFYTAVANLTLALVTDHYQSLLGDTTFTLDKDASPSIPNLLDEDKTGLKEIAAFLITPVYSGFFLSRDDIGRLARGFDLPRGFGDRQQLLTNLLRTAVQYDQFSLVIIALQTAVTEWQTTYRTISQENPLLTPFTASWLIKTEHTLHLLGHMQTQLEGEMEKGE